MLFASSQTDAEQEQDLILGKPQTKFVTQKNRTYCETHTTSLGYQAGRQASATKTKKKRVRE